MELNSALAAGAVLVSLAATLAIFEQLLARKQQEGNLHLLNWGVSLFLFTAASISLWAGAVFGWTEEIFRVFYLLGGILNVLFLALGSVYFVASKKVAGRIQLATLLFSFLCIGVLWAAPANSIEDPDTLPQGSDVFGALPRILVAFSSSLGAIVVFGVGIFSIWQYLKNKSSTNRIWGAGLVALGTLILSVGGLFNSLADEMQVFAITILLGVSALFAGFLVSTNKLTSQQEKLN